MSENTNDGIEVYDKAVAPQPREAFFTDRPCSLLRYHAPMPVMTEYHHSKPVFLQNRLYGRIVFGADQWLCSNCHDAVHAWLYYLLGEWRQPPYIGRAARTEAERIFAWWQGEVTAMGKEVGG